MTHGLWTYCAPTTHLPACTLPFAAFHCFLPPFSPFPLLILLAWARRCSPPQKPASRPFWGMFIPLNEGTFFPSLSRFIQLSSSRFGDTSSFEVHVFRMFSENLRRNPPPSGTECGACSVIVIQRQSTFGPPVRSRPARAFCDKDFFLASMFYGDPPPGKACFVFADFSRTTGRIFPAQTIHQE